MSGPVSPKTLNDIRQLCLASIAITHRSASKSADTEPRLSHRFSNTEFRLAPQACSALEAADSRGFGLPSPTTPSTTYWWSGCCRQPGTPN